MWNLSIRRPIVVLGAQREPSSCPTCEGCSSGTEDMWTSRVVLAQLLAQCIHCLLTRQRRAEVEWLSELLPGDLHVAEYVGDNVEPLRLALWLGYRRTTGVTADGDRFSGDLHFRRSGHGPRQAGPPESTRLPEYFFRGLPSRAENLRGQLVRWEVVTTEIPRLFSVDTPPPGMHRLVEPSGVPPPADAARLDSGQARMAHEGSGR